MFENLLNTNKIAYFSVTEGLIGDSNEDPLMPWLRSGLNERERTLVSIRTKSALNRKKERGERLGGGIRYGYSVINGQIIQNEYEQNIVKRIKELQSQDYPTRAIAQRLNSEGFKPRRGTQFHQTQIIRILKSA
jgi:DNA invertase Pin-like site-specific DNA recombinase